MAQRSILWTIVAVVVLASLAGCRAGTITGTEIPDTDENRAVYARVLSYQNAMESRDVDAILAMVSRQYYENSGTTDTDRDDYGYETLRDDVLPKLKENIKAVQYRLIMRRIVVEGTRAHADYEFFYRFKFVEGGREGWAQKNDFNRLEFLLEDGTWKIVSGL